MNTDTSSNMAVTFGPFLALADIPHLSSLPRLLPSDLELQNKRIKVDYSRVFIVTYKGKDHIMKNFQLECKTESNQTLADAWDEECSSNDQSDELPSRRLQNEIKAYELLAKNGSTLGPKLVAFICGRDTNQVIGFVCEKVEGWEFRERDSESCRQNLVKLHELGVMHGDLGECNSNLLITEQGPRFFDFEYARFLDDESVSPQDFENYKKRELEDLTRMWNLGGRVVEGRVGENGCDMFKLNLQVFKILNLTIEKILVNGSCYFPEHHNRYTF